MIVRERWGLVLTFRNMQLVKIKGISHEKYAARLRHIYFEQFPNSSIDILTLKRNSASTKDYISIKFSLSNFIVLGRREKAWLIFKLTLHCI